MDDEMTGTSSGPSTPRDPRYQQEIVKLDGSPFYVRIDTGPNLESALLCYDDGEPDTTDIAKFVSLTYARGFIANWNRRTVAPAPGGGEAVAWQWSDFSGNWYTVDTARMSISDQEILARTAAKSHEGRVRPLYAAPDKAAGLGEATEAEHVDVQTLLDVVTMFRRHQRRGGYLSKHDTWPYIDKVLDAAITLATAFRTRPATGETVEAAMVEAALIAFENAGGFKHISVNRGTYRQTFIGDRPSAMRAALRTLTAAPTPPVAEQGVEIERLRKERDHFADLATVRAGEDAPPDTFVYERDRANAAEAKVAGLRAALEKIAERIETGFVAGVVDIAPPANYTKGEHFNALVVSVRDTARAALKGQPNA